MQSNSFYSALSAIAEVFQEEGRSYLRIPSGTLPNNEYAAAVEKYSNRILQAKERKHQNDTIKVGLCFDVDDLKQEALLLYIEKYDYLVKFFNTLNSSVNDEDEIITSFNKITNKMVNRMLTKLYTRVTDKNTQLRMTKFPRLFSEFLDEDDNELIEFIQGTAIDGGSILLSSEKLIEYARLLEDKPKQLLAIMSVFLGISVDSMRELLQSKDVLCVFNQVLSQYAYELEVPEMLHTYLNYCTSDQLRYNQPTPQQVRKAISNDRALAKAKIAEYREKESLKLQKI